MMAEEKKEDKSPVLLDLVDLRTYFISRDGVSKAVDGVSYQIRSGKTLGVVGESGCGKSVTALSIMRLIPQPPGKIVSGRIMFKGEDILKISEKAMRRLRGNSISMIFQEPMTSLNPVFTIGDQIGEVFRIHQGMSKKESIKESIRMLEMVKIPAAKDRVHDYPHQMSGGMRQRVMIAMALACNPDLLVADEPTTALDVTVQAQILDLMADLKETYGSSILMITHDLGVISEISDDVAVMYSGQVVEFATTRKLFGEPQHPYTLGLMNSIPKLSDIQLKTRLKPILGAVPSPMEHPTGCRFNPRCPFSDDRCHQEEPEMREISPGSGHTVRCHHVEEILSGARKPHGVEVSSAG